MATAEWARERAERCEQNAARWAARGLPGWAAECLRAAARLRGEAAELAARPPEPPSPEPMPRTEDSVAAAVVARAWAPEPPLLGSHPELDWTLTRGWQRGGAA